MKVETLKKGNIYYQQMTDLKELMNYLTKSNDFTITVELNDYGEEGNRPSISHRFAQGNQETFIKVRDAMVKAVDIARAEASANLEFLTD